MQTFVTKHFFNLYIFTLIFGHIFYGTIGFDFTDEICALILLILFSYNVIKNPQWEINKAFLITIGIFLFYLCYSLYIRSNVTSGIISDFIIQFKPYLAFWGTYSLMPKFDINKKKILRWIAVSCWVIQLTLAITEIFRHSTLADVMGHSTYFAAGVIATSICFLYTGDFSLKDKLLFLGMLSIGLISTRSKFYGLYAFSVFLILYFSKIKHFTLNFKNIMIIIGVVAIVIIVAWQKIHFYFYQTITNEVDKDMIARYVLYVTSPQIIIDYFPFGSGFATYGTFSSGVYYSHIYVDYGIDTVWGMSRDFYSYVADTFYPSLAQFGICGIFLYITFWMYIVKKAINFNRQYKQNKLLIIVLFIVTYFAIEGTSDSTFTTHRGIYMLMTLGLIMAEMKYKYQELIKIHKNENITN